MCNTQVTNMSYQELASVYDYLMADIDYQQWADYIETLINDNNSPGRKILDLGCGTGKITLLLAQKGFSLLGVDKSIEMLSQAEQRFRAYNLNIPLFRQDIRNFSLPEKVDVVISTFDTLNYCVNNYELEQVLKNIYKVLKKDGLLIFDLNTDYYLQEELGNNIFTYNTEELSYIWENEYDDKEKLTYMNITFFSLDTKTGQYNRFVEHHIQRDYQIEEVKKILQGIGFQIINVYGKLKTCPPSKKDKKIFYIAKKN